MRIAVAFPLACLLTGLLAACTTPPPQPVPPPQPIPCENGPYERDPQLRKGPLPEPDTPPQLDHASVYFDYDSFIVKSDYAPLLKKQTQFINYIAQDPAEVQVIGNADERGSAEYNLALGQKRAEAVKKALLAQGAKEKQIEAISFGKEKPVALEHDEAAWAKNRRVDFVIANRPK